MSLTSSKEILERFVSRGAKGKPCCISKTLFRHWVVNVLFRKMINHTARLMKYIWKGEKKDLHVGKFFSKEFQISQTHWTNFFLKNSLCIMAYKSHLGCCKGEETVMVHHDQGPENVERSQAGPGQQKSPADFHIGRTWTQPSIQSSESGPGHAAFLCECLAPFPTGPPGERWLQS